MEHKPFPRAEERTHHERCPLCGHERLRPLGTPFRHGDTPVPYSRCLRCDLIFMTEMPSQAWYNGLYQSEFWEVKQTKKTNAGKGQARHQVRKEATWAEKFIHVLDGLGFARERPRPRILEIGCAYGMIGKLIAEHFGGEAMGVEPSDSARAFAEAYTGVAPFKTNMDGVIAGEEAEIFDLVLFSHVLENIIDPVAALRAARRLLKPKGLLLIDTPNNFVRRSWHIHHPYCFTPVSIRYLLGTAGFALESRRIWSRPKYVLGRGIYITLVARKGDEAACQAELVPSTGGDDLRRALGYLSFCLFNRSYGAKLNGMLARRAWPIDSLHQAAVDRVLAAAEGGSEGAARGETTATREALLGAPGEGSSEAG